MLVLPGILIGCTINPQYINAPPTMEIYKQPIDNKSKSPPPYKVPSNPRKSTYTKNPPTQSIAHYKPKRQRGPRIPKPKPIVIIAAVPPPKVIYVNKTIVTTKTPTVIPPTPVFTKEEALNPSIVQSRLVDYIRVLRHELKKQQ
jgi:hypothetical protein